MERKISILIFTIIIGCFYSTATGNPAPIQSIDTVTLQLKWKHQFQFAGYYAAIEKGYYQKNGLYVHLIEATNDNEAVSTVITGDAEYGVASSDLLIKFQMGFPVVVLANIFQHSPYVFLTLKNQSTDNIHNISGETVMLEEHANELQAYLLSEQIALSSINFISHSFSPNDLILGEVFAMSAYSTDEPFLLKEAGIEYNIYNPRSSSIDFFGDVLFTSREEIQNDPARVEAFRQASIEGWYYAMEHPDEMIDLIYHKYSKRHSIDHLKFEATQTARLIMPEVVEIGYVNRKRWQQIGEVYNDLGMLPADFSLEGFFYDKDAEPEFFVKHRNTLIIFFIAIFIAIIAIYYYRLNKKLARSNADIKSNEVQMAKLEKQYRDLSDYSPLPVLITSVKEGDILYINEMACEEFKISKALALKKQVSSFYVNPNDRKKVIDKLNNVGKVRDEAIRMKDTSGNEFWTLITSNYIYFNGHDALISITWDISGRVMLEQQLRKANEYKDTLFSVIAHDLKGPIGTLDYLLDSLVELDPDSHSKRTNLFQKLQSSTKSTSRLLDNLLKWVLSQKDGISYHPQQASLCENISANVDIYAVDAANKEITLTNNCNLGIKAFFDEEMINVVVRNLLSNALKFTRKGGEISINSTEEGEYIKVWVKDNGTGMTRDQVVSLFEPHSTYQNINDDKNGTGLGLRLCKDFVERNKGRIWVESEKGVGSTFYFTLPKA